MCRLHLPLLAQTQNQIEDKQRWEISQGAHYNAVIRFLSVLTTHTGAICKQQVEPARDWRSDCLEKQGEPVVEICGVLGRLHSSQGLAQSNNNAKLNYSAKHETMLLDTSTTRSGASKGGKERYAETEKLPSRGTLPKRRFLAPKLASPGTSGGDPIGKFRELSGKKKNAEIRVPSEKLWPFSCKVSETARHKPSLFCSKLSFCIFFLSFFFFPQPRKQKTARKSEVVKKTNIDECEHSSRIKNGERSAVRSNKIAMGA